MRKLLPPGKLVPAPVKALTTGHLCPSLADLITMHSEIFPHDGQLAVTLLVNMPKTGDPASGAEMNSCPQRVHLSHLAFVFIHLFRSQ
jgi:hypothetical protein